MILDRNTLDEQNKSPYYNPSTPVKSAPSLKDFFREPCKLLSEGYSTKDHLSHDFRE